MEILGVTLNLGFLGFLGARHGDRAVDVPPKDIIQADGSMVGVASVGDLEPVQISHFRRTCGCKNIGCTM